MKKISRREFLSTSSAFLAFSAIAGKQALAKNRKKPNVLFIAVDDLRVQLNCYGKKEIKSPNIDSLANDGVLFKHAYCQQAVCNPSRASLLTGMRPDTCKVWDLHTHFRDTVPDVKTLPQWFKENGYVSVGLGKIYHGNLLDPESWSEPFDLVLSDKYVDPENVKKIEEQTKAALAKGLKGKALRVAKHGPAFEHPDVPDDAYSDGKIAKKSINLLRKLAKGKKPFFLAVGFKKPHLPFNAPKKYWDMYDENKIKLADNPFLPEGAPKLARTSWGELRAFKGIPKKGPVPDELAKKLIHGYYACVSYIDAQIGKLIKELKRLKLYDNTIIVLWGDHGWKLGEHGMWAKHTNFELDANAPLIVKAPGTKKGVKSNALVEFVDIYPTLCDLAGLKKPEHLEGYSFYSLLKNPKLKWKKAAFSQYPRQKGRIMGYSVRTERYRYTEWIVRKTGKIKARELYDHLKDDKENVNVVNKPEYKEVVKKLHKILHDGWRKAVPPVE